MFTEFQVVFRVSSFVGNPVCTEDVLTSAVQLIRQLL